MAIVASVGSDLPTLQSLGRCALCWLLAGGSARFRWTHRPRCPARAVSPAL